MQRHKSQANDLSEQISNIKSELTKGYKVWSNTNGITEMNSPDSNTRMNTNAIKNKNPFDLNTTNINNSNTFMVNNTGNGGGGDELDDQEAFDQLELERVLASDPDSLAFFQAQKTRRANLTQNGGNIRQMQKNKRFN